MDVNGHVVGRTFPSGCVYGCSGRSDGPSRDDAFTRQSYPTTRGRHYILWRLTIPLTFELRRRNPFSVGKEEFPEPHR